MLVSSVSKLSEPAARPDLLVPILCVLLLCSSVFSVFGRSEEARYGEVIDFLRSKNAKWHQAERDIAEKVRCYRYYRCRWCFDTDNLISFLFVTILVFLS